MTPFSDLDVTASATGAIDTRVEGYFSSSPFSVERRITLKAFFSALRKLSVKAVLGLQKEVCSLFFHVRRIDYLTYFGLQT